MNAQVNSLHFADQNVSTYFRTSDVIPYIENNQINIWNGTAYQASWGRSEVSSTITQLSDDVVKVEVVGWHKHTVSPEGGNYYFVNEKGRWTRRRANAKAVKAVL